MLFCSNNSLDALKCLEMPRLNTNNIIGAVYGFLSNSEVPISNPQYFQVFSETLLYPPGMHKSAGPRRCEPLLALQPHHLPNPV